MRILSIETSCDDTGVALLEIKGDRIKILSDFVSSQVKIHAPYGGVVPNLAVRAHYKNLPILLEKTFKKFDSKNIDLIAVTVGPGLEPCLWAGVRAARVLSLAMKKPIIGVDHLEGHIAANWLGPIGGNPKPETRNQKPLFPAICLVVSGGHTQLVLIRGMGKYKVIGQTRDDAAGEAFDKVAKLLGLGYPGGPEIALSAQNGTPDAFKLPRPMIDAPNFDFSFSGLKTAVLYLVREGVIRQSFCDLGGGWGSAFGGAFTKRLPNHPLITNRQPLTTDLCASFQQAVVDVLVSKTIRAAKEYGAKTVMLSGGVAANKELRKQMASAVKKNIHNASFLLPDPRYCTDNAAMIGLAGYWKYARHGRGDKVDKIIARANLNL
ncbi:MAG: tRNA (adenosine(37)-N6)-threonylcarbamoyltransferase complex transferase subunit TsaD [Candidatus Portnoybacteria bacterium]|nr:tRNA (adenosine(37)-N6)-threonylcarbamoyltransferase complex transferase subunit TsaD [Candidatus Portnoybacteria bacterium]